MDNLKSLKEDVTKYNKNNGKIKFFALTIKNSDNFLLKYTEEEVLKTLQSEFKDIKLIEVDDPINFDPNILIKNIID